MTFALTIAMTTPRAVLRLSLVLLLTGHACTITRPTSHVERVGKQEAQ